MFRRIDPAAENQGRFLLLGFLVALALIIMISDQVGLLRIPETAISTVANPVENATYHLGQNLNDYSVFLGSLDKLRTENADLRQQLEAEKAKGNATVLAQLETQLDIKDSEVQFDKNPYFKNLTKVPSLVLQHDTTGQNQAITIDKGSNDGLKNGQVVLDSTGNLVGRVGQVQSNKASVLLLTDNSIAVKVVTQRYDANHKKVDIPPVDATVQGEWQNGGTISMVHIPANANVKVNDVLLTAGGDGIYPANVGVGTITAITKRTGEPEQSATVIPAASLSNLSKVIVVTSLSS